MVPKLTLFTLIDDLFLKTWKNKKIIFKLTVRVLLL
jgi:hypothetical protein